MRLVELALPGTDGAVSWPGLIAVGPPTGAISGRLALVAAATVVTSPHLTAPFRSVSRWLLGITVVGLVVLAATTPGGALLGVLGGTAAAAAVHLLLGSSGGQPSLDEVRDALGELGVDAVGLSPARRQTAGVYLVDAVVSTGAPLVVKVFGRDAWDAQVLAKTWRALWHRDAAAVTLTRLQQAVHEAFVNLLAARAGVPVETLVTAGRSSGSTAVVVLRHAGPSLGEVTPDARRRSLPAMWEAVQALSAAGIGHGDLGFETFVLRGEQVLLTGLGNASVSASGDQRRIDLAQLVVTGALLDGIEASLPLGTLLVIIVGVSLFSGLMPVPGGIGVAEGAFIVGLTAAGIDPATSFATAIAYRLVTFYLPPLWGGVAMRRLERDGLL